MTNQVIIPFQSHWLHKMLVGIKTCTTRTKRYGNPGDKFTHFGANFIILSIEKYRLDYVAEFLYRQEGYDSLNEFKNEWLRLHPIKGWVPNQIVFTHFFKKER